MPTYQYVCTNPEVKHEFERVQSFSDPAVTICPECEAPVRKVYGSVGVVFKGSGFYRTDSRSDSGSKSASVSAGKDGGSSSSSTSSSPSTPTPKSGDSSSSSSTSSSSGSGGSSTGSGSKAAS